MIDLKERVSQFLSARTLSNLLLVWGRLRDVGVALTSAVPVGVLANAVETGRAYTLSTELGTAADACPLAGATRPDQTPGSCVRAMQAAINANLANTETSRV